MLFRSGFVDLYVTNSGRGDRNVLFRNLGNGSFEDVTEAAGVGCGNPIGAAMHAVWGDVDNDGDLDVVVSGQTADGQGRLAVLANDGAGGFSATPPVVTPLSAAGRAVPTNQQGSFTLSVPPGRHTVTVSVIGYQDGTAVVNVASGASATVEIRLTQTALLLNPLTVTATRQQSQRSISAPAAVNVATGRKIWPTIVGHGSTRVGISMPGC